MATFPRTPSRRAVLGSALWTVPAVSIAGASPAFAASPGAATCCASLTHSAAWTASSHVGRGRDTGWYVNGTWYRGLNNEPWNAQASDLPDDTFPSFENNPSKAQNLTVTLSWTFQVTGNVHAELRP